MAGSVFFGNFAAANPCPVPGLVPGVCYPAGFPATTPVLAENFVSGLASPDSRRSLRAFFAGRPRTYAELTALLDQWAHAAWNTWQAENSAHARVDGAVDDVLRFYLSSKRDMRERWLPAWRRQIDDLRARWDARYAPYQALHRHLEGFPQEATASGEAHSEVKRQAASYAGLAEAIAADLAQQQKQLLDVIKERERSGAFTTMLREAVAIVTGYTVEAVRWTVANVAVPIVGGVFAGLPRWLLVLLVGAGGLLVYGVVSGNPLVGAPRRALRRG